VFVLALTQCTALMARTPTWEGLLKGLLVLGVLWWSWAGYAWLTSVVDPEEGSVRLVMFAAMSAFLVAALCVPRAFGADALLFACAYAAVRTAHTLNRQRLICAAALAALLLADAQLKPPSLATLGVLAGLLTALIVYEATRFAELRDRVRHQLAREGV
jgi:low temperature requirement protein LtrA